MRIIIFVLALMLVGLGTVQAAPDRQASCQFFGQTVEGSGGFNVCDDGQARFLSAVGSWGVERIGYPISRRYNRDGFVTQAFQKAIMQWRAESGTVALVNIFDDLHRDGFDNTLRRVRQTPLQANFTGEASLSFEQVIAKRQALLNGRPAMRTAYFSVNDPLLFFGLPTSEIKDMGNHYAIRLQRAVLQEWKQDVPWARAGQVTIANGGDIAKELGALPTAGLSPEGSASAPPAAQPSPTANAQPTSKPASQLPPITLLEPDDDASVNLYDSNVKVTFKWEWNGTLDANQVFDVRVWKEGTSPHTSIAVTTETSYIVDNPLSVFPPGRYEWSVAVMDRTTGKEVVSEASPRKLAFDGSQKPTPVPDDND